MALIPFELRVQHDDMGNAPHLMDPWDRVRAFGEVPVWHRAGGGCICTDCGKEYNDHPAVLGALWLTRLCDDSFVKL